MTETEKAWRDATRELLRVELHTLRTEHANTYELADYFRDSVHIFMREVEVMAIEILSER